MVRGGSERYAYEELHRYNRLRADLKLNGISRLHSPSHICRSAVQYLFSEGHAALASEVYFPCVSGEGVQQTLMQQLHHILGILLADLL